MYSTPANLLKASFIAFAFLCALGLGLSVNPAGADTLHVAAAPTVTASSYGTTVTFTMSNTPQTKWTVYRNNVAVYTSSSGMTAVVRNQPFGTASYTVAGTAAANNATPSTPVTVTVALPAPRNFNVTRSATDIKLSADTVPGATQYRISRNGAVIYTGTSPSFTDAGRTTMGGTWNYAIMALVGTSTGPASYGSVTITPPATPTLKVTGVGTTVYLAMSGPSPANWYIYRDGEYMARTWSGSLNWSYASQPLGTHTYTVRAVTAGGVSLESNKVAVTFSLAQPSSLTASPSDLDVVLRSSDVPGAFKYRFARNGVTVQETMSYYYTDKGRGQQPGTYTYTVTPIGNAGQVGPSRSITITVTIPALPKISIVIVDGRTVGMNITSTPGTGVDIFRNGVHLFNTTSAASSYHSLINQPLGTHTYTARARSAYGVSALTAPISATVDTDVSTARPDVSIDGTDISIFNWPMARAVRYKFYRDGVLIADQTSHVFWDKERALTPGTYKYSVRAVDVRGNLGGEGFKTITISPQTAAPIITASSPSAGSVTFSAPNIEPNSVGKWVIYRNGVQVAVVKGFTNVFTVTGLPAGAATYTVRGSGFISVTKLSNPVPVTVK